MARSARARQPRCGAPHHLAGPAWRARIMPGIAGADHLLFFPDSAAGAPRFAGFHAPRPRSPGKLARHLHASVCLRHHLARSRLPAQWASARTGGGGGERTPLLGPPGGAGRARVSGARTVMVFGLFCGGNRYRIIFESLDQSAAQADKMAGAPSRDAESQSLERYVASLERHAQYAPYNWFNFYDYWAA